MEILKNLVRKNEDFIFSGDLLIKEDVILQDCSLIVSGQVAFTNLMAKILVINGDIVAEEIISYSDIVIRNGDIWTRNLIAVNIDSNQNIEVKYRSSVVNVVCFNYLVSGSNYSAKILAMQDIYILGKSESESIFAGRDAFIGKTGDFSGFGIMAKKIECLSIKDCNYIIER